MRPRATLAQSVEQLIRNQQVVGSNPTGGSIKANKNPIIIATTGSAARQLPLYVHTATTNRYLCPWTKVFADH